mmetsp:Transcript_13965/g.39531  ORF Transcript_13965/g.39531 Transcript_13965/m.39531 type:complete len:400 (-) Transcript_13965:176-1375(-)
MTAEDEELVIQEYNIWKKNSPFLYDLVIAHSLDWPSLTLQWLPETRREQNCTVHQLLLGTHTSDGEQNSVILADVSVADDSVEIPPKDDNEEGTGTGMKSSTHTVNVVKKIPHAGEVNRARYCPQRPQIVATKAISGDVCLFDTSAPVCKASQVKPLVTLGGHSEEGYGLAWSNAQQGRLLSGSNDSRICLWDTAGAAGPNLAPLSVFQVHSGYVNDVSWSAADSYTFASVGDDCKLMIFDARKPASAAVVQETKVHDSAVNCVAFHPSHGHLLATGSADQTVGLFDTRNLKAPLHSLAHHTGDVYQISWSPQCETMLASGAADRRLMLWDLSNIGAEQSSEDAEDGPPELAFVHGGHIQKVADFGWNCNPGAEWMLASVADDNILQIYTPAATALLGN